MPNKSNQIRMFSTFASGLTPIIVDFLQNDIDLHFINRWDGFVEYVTDVSQIDKIKHLLYLQNSFVIIESNRCDINSMVNSISQNAKALNKIHIASQFLPNKKELSELLYPKKTNLLASRTIPCRELKKAYVILQD